LKPNGGFNPLKSLTTAVGTANFSSKEGCQLVLFETWKCAGVVNINAPDAQVYQMRNSAIGLGGGGGGFVYTFFAYLCCNPCEP
jgi:hypothetical protein